MTDIGKINAPHNVQKQESKKPSSKAEICECHEDEAPKKSTNLNDDPGAVLGKSMVKDNKYTIHGARLYEDTPWDTEKSVEDDVETFRILKPAIEEYRNALIERGYDPNAAEDKALQFAACLMSHENV